MLLNVAMIDYLTLTSFEAEDHQQFMSVWQKHKTPQTTPGHELDRRMQYRGFSSSHGFVGRGTQRGRAHYLTQYSGQPAHIAFSHLLDRPFLDVRCTRLDAQITIEQPADYDARLIFDELDGTLPHQRKVTMIQGGDGFDTIYLGSRKTQNGRFTRIYVKEHAEGRALRFETEFMSTFANDQWDWLRQGGAIEELLVWELESTGTLENHVLRRFYDIVKGHLPAPKPRAVETANNTLQWLMDTVEPAVRRMLADHDHGRQTRRLVESWLDWPSGNG